MCRCVNNRFISKLAYLEHMRILMSGPYLPKRQSIYDMEPEELKIFKKEVREFKISLKEQKEQDI